MSFAVIVLNGLSCLLTAVPNMTSFVWPASILGLIIPYPYGSDCKMYTLVVSLQRNSKQICCLTSCSLKLWLSLEKKIAVLCLSLLLFLAAVKEPGLGSGFCLLNHNQDNDSLFANLLQIKAQIDFLCSAIMLQ